jgi:hypothetical protein
MVAADIPPANPPHQVPTPMTRVVPDAPRLWPALPPATRRLLAQELAGLLRSMRTRNPSAAAPGTEAAHAEHVSPR